MSNDFLPRRDFLAASLAAAGTLATRAAHAAPAVPQALRFGLITDAQYADAPPNGERHYRATPEKLRQAVQHLAKSDLAFTLHLGDLIDHDYSSFSTMVPMFDDLKHPVYHVLGNHEFSVAEGDKCRVTSTLGMPHDFYQFRHSNVRFLVLDTNDVSTYKHPQGSPLDKAGKATFEKITAEKQAGAKNWNGGLSDQQLAWLDRELSAADAAKERVFLCAHHPLLPADFHRIWNAEGVLAVIDKHPCVCAWFAGHNHAGSEETRNGIPFVTFRSLLHDPQTTAYAIITVGKDTLAIEGFGREPSRTFPLRA